MKKKYNWWEDPSNKKIVDRISWWNHPDKKESYPFPISVTQDGNKWTACTNEETKSLIGDRLSGVASGDTKEDAIYKMFKLIAIQHEYTHDRMLKYQRWVPFRSGGWSRVGSCWVAIFGIHFHFRYGNNMKGGFYIPFTKLNISIHNEWVTYNNYVKLKKRK